MTIKNIKDYSTIALALIAIFAVVMNVWGIPDKVAELEKQVEEQELRIKTLENTITDMHARLVNIETLTRQLHTYFLKKGLESK